MPRTIRLQKITLSTKAEPVSIVVDKITMVSEYKRSSNQGLGSLITLVGGETLRVIEPREQVERLISK